MYVPRFNAWDDRTELRAFVASVATAELITTGPDGYPLATRLPILWRATTVTAHVARANPHWRAIAAGTPALLVCTGPDAYISPSWYAAKEEHGRVVPTWNYSAVHLVGRATAHDDPEWLRAAVSDLTDHHEAGRPAPWRVADAPTDYLRRQLRAIVGIEVKVERVEGKAKLSQNRSDEDREGVIAGLRAEGTPDAWAVADAMGRIDPRW
ncbi:MAG: FMN-binding negative transcriptional regulator [Jatrophihabitans sp.]|uniref:FMN-binding negative transcriptional regulator n=1 Tax=Jatrophihabitans sp. TaxID=1932789 RepID=UPI003F7F98D7